MDVKRNLVSVWVEFVYVRITAATSSILCQFSCDVVTALSGLIEKQKTKQNKTKNVNRAVVTKLAKQNITQWAHIIPKIVKFRLVFE